jgi:hypothetical protein
MLFMNKFSFSIKINGYFSVKFRNDIVLTCMINYRIKNILSRYIFLMTNKVKMRMTSANLFFH